MHPVLFKFGQMYIYSYGAMLAAAFLVSSFLARRAAKEANIPPDIITDLALWMLFSGIIGARLLYVLLNIQQYAQNPLEIFMLQRGGLAFYGGAAAALITAALYIKYKRHSIYKIGDLIIPYVALGQAIGRIGCFLNGCCFGRPADSFFGVVFPHTTQAIHPTQIYSSLALIFLYGFLRLLQKLKVKEGVVLISYGLLYSAGRFFMEFLRADNSVVVLGFTFSQFTGVLVFIGCVLLLWKKIK